MHEKCYVPHFPGFKIYFIFYTLYYKRKCFKSTGVLILNSYKISPSEENSKWKIVLSLVMNIMIFLHVVLYTLLEIYRSSGGMYCLKMVVLHSFGMSIRLYSVTFQKPTIITFTKMYSCCYRHMQTLFFILNTVTHLTMQS